MVTTAPQFRSFTALTLLWGAVLLSLGGCRTAVPIPPFNVAEAGWQVRQGQAVWRARTGLPPLAGEIVVAWNRDGRGFVQFTKTPFTLLNARISPLGWTMEFPPQRRSYRGNGPPPSRFGWLHLLRTLAGQPLDPPWEMAGQADGDWCLRNPRTGEQIEGFLSP